MLAGGESDVGSFGFAVVIRVVSDGELFGFRECAPKDGAYDLGAVG